ncbi:cupin domain-containing protein [Streptomyces sp. WMMB303]|uniref:cupin domain-containing protein n=1 Tax=Streptomyces sp. WMMB303 TaxID=3034154 RepID=UPI0023EC90C2|nr:cupin domain-containing protein [Streptomyces sp. WMMB303]MDF4249574.1 cupin domain-containing protein [Streptomyces sp. WMMB303]
MTYAWPPSREFWNDEFPAKTDARTAPHLFKGLIPSSAASPSDVLGGFTAIRHAYAADTQTKAKARVYVGEERRDDLLPEVLTASAWPEGGFVEWMQSVVDAERFSLVINNLETVSPPLAKGLGTFLASLFDGWGVPLGGAEQVAFAGNYAGTAFGVHEGYEDAFLIHLGPGTKNFYTWPGGEYEKLTGGTGPLYGDYRWLLKHGRHFVLEPGDALFLPRRVFHVGRQNEFSVSVAVPLYTYPDAGLMRQAILPELLDSLLADRGRDDERSQPSPMASQAEGDGPVAQRLAHLARTTLTTAAEQAEEAVEQHVRQRWETVLSNGGWELAEDDLSRSLAAAAFDARDVKPGATASLVPPYRLRVAGERVFLRGFQIAIDAHVLEADMVSALNAGASVPLPHDDNVLAAVRALGATGGLKVTTRSTASEDPTA